MLKAFLMIHSPAGFYSQSHNPLDGELHQPFQSAGLRRRPDPHLFDGLLNLLQVYVFGFLQQRALVHSQHRHAVLAQLHHHHVRLHGADGLRGTGGVTNGFIETKRQKDKESRSTLLCPTDSPWLHPSCCCRWSGRCPPGTGRCRRGQWDGSPSPGVLGWTGAAGIAAARASPPSHHPLKDGDQTNVMQWWEKDLDLSGREMSHSDRFNGISNHFNDEFEVTGVSSKKKNL